MIYFVDKEHFEDALDNCVKLISGQTTSPITIHTNENKNSKSKFILLSELDQEFKDRASRRISNEEIPEIRTYGKTLTDNDVTIMYETIMTLCEIRETDKITLEDIYSIDNDKDFYFDNFFDLKNKFNPQM